MRGKRAARHGFTLIELLVVIAIIAILAAILFPVLTKAKQAGQRSACASSMGQIVKAMRMYADDWGGYLPWANAYYNYPAGDQNSPPDRKFVGVVLAPYQAKKWDVWQCVATPYKATDPNFYFWVYYYNLFCYNTSWAAKWPDPSSLAGQRMDRPNFTTGAMGSPPRDWSRTRPSRIPMLWDQRYTVWDPVNRRYATDKKYDLIHYDGWNTLYMDGHVKYYYKDNRTWTQTE